MRVFIQGRIDVVLPTRIPDVPYSGRTLSRRPIVLAQLPYVGEDARVESSELSVASGKQRAESQKKNPGSHQESHSKSSRSRRHRKNSSRLQERKKPQNGWSDKTSSQASQSTGLVASFSQLHSQVVPYAGVIVALALIASAGLMYWMIVNPSRVPTDFHDTGQSGFQARPARLPEFVPALPRFAAESNATSDSKTPFNNLSWWESSEIATGVSAAPLEETQFEETQSTPPLEKEQILSIEEPVIDAPAEQTSLNATEQTVSPPSEPNFPTTNRPAALDFAKIHTELRRL